MRRTESQAQKNAISKPKIGRNPHPKPQNLSVGAPRPRSTRDKNCPWRERAAVKLQLYPVFISIRMPQTAAPGPRSTRKKRPGDDEPLSNSKWGSIGDRYQHPTIFKVAGCVKYIICYKKVDVRKESNDSSNESRRTRRSDNYS